MAKWRVAVGSGLVLLVTVAVAWCAVATDARMYFASDKDGQNPVTNIEEGNSIWICVYEPDENIDCDLRDKIWTDVKIMDPKTGAYIVWESFSSCTLGAPDGYKGRAGCTTQGDYLEETGADTGLFVSQRAFQVGTRESYAVRPLGTHIVGPYHYNASVTLTDFKWGHYDYADVRGENSTKFTPTINGDTRGWFGADGSHHLVFTEGLCKGSQAVLPSELRNGRAKTATEWLVGRFENMDTLIGMYQDPNDDKDVAVTMGKIVDWESRIAWDEELYKDPRGAATITVTDRDENLDCSRVEYVPVFIFVNPGSWNPVNSSTLQTQSTGTSPNNFCMLKQTGGVAGGEKDLLVAIDPDPGDDGDRRMRWYNIYNADKNDYGISGAMDGRYYIQYPVEDVAAQTGLANSRYYETTSANGVTAVSFYAQETGANTGIFKLKLNDILRDLGFKGLNVGDVLVAYYLDPNDEDDFRLATAYIEERSASLTSFTDALGQKKALYWLGRDPVYVQVIASSANEESCCPEQVVVHICDPHSEDDGEFWILDETSPNSPVFFSIAGMELLPAWNALGIGEPGRRGGYQLRLDNWKLEAYNEDSIYVRYNDVTYTANVAGMRGLGDLDTTTAFSGPRIDRVRVDNDVSFDLMKIGDTQVYNGTAATMYFLDRQGNRISGYTNSDSVYIEVIDPDQDEDRSLRERVDGYWDGGQNIPFGPVALNAWSCTYTRTQTHPFNALLGDTNIFNDSPHPVLGTAALAPKAANGLFYGGWPKVYVLNPRNGRWAATDILETQVGSADFVSVLCIDLASASSCVPTLGALAGDTILAFYQDPSNHSDSAMISIKVSRRSGGTLPSQAGEANFCSASGTTVTAYCDTEQVYVKVKDPSHAGAPSLAGAVAIGTKAFDLTSLGTLADTFITRAITLVEIGATVGQTITALYTDPSDPQDTSETEATIIGSVLDVTGYLAKPNPFWTETFFAYKGTGIASTFTVTVYDQSGHPVWSKTEENTTEVRWDGKDDAGMTLSNGAYIYVVVLSDNEGTKAPYKGKVFIRR
jgi:hypothetical protein